MLKTILTRKQGGLKKRNRLLRPPTPSKQSEVWYRRQLLSFVNLMQNIVIDELEQTTITDAPSANPLQVKSKLSRAIRRLSQMFVSDIASRMSLGLVRRANEQNKRQTQATFKNAFNIDLTNMLSDEVVRSDLMTAIKENVELIKSIQTDFINDIGSSVFSNLKDGSRSENLISLIKERGDVTISRAKLIARDQTSKLNAALSKSRSESLGLDLYEWGGTGDERERESHNVLNGKVCKYSDPTVYSDDGGKTWKMRSSIGAFVGHPGEDYQCRCRALPYINWD